MEEENEERKFQNQKTRMKNYCFYFLEMRPVIPSKKKKKELIQKMKYGKKCGKGKIKPVGGYYFKRKSSDKKNE